MRRVHARLSHGKNPDHPRPSRSSFFLAPPAVPYRGSGHRCRSCPCPSFPVVCFVRVSRPFLTGPAQWRRVRLFHARAYGDAGHAEIDVALRDRDAGIGPDARTTSSGFHAIRVVSGTRWPRSCPGWRFRRRIRVGGGFQVRHDTAGPVPLSFRGGGGPVTSVAPHRPCRLTTVRSLS